MTICSELLGLFVPTTILSQVDTRRVTGATNSCSSTSARRTTAFLKKTDSYMEHAVQPNRINYDAYEI